MANRQLLPIKLKGEFETWLKGQGYAVFEPCGIYEVIRAKKDGKWLFVYTKTDATEHLSVAEKDCHIVRQFLDERRKQCK